MAVIGVAEETAGTDDKAAVKGGGEPDLWDPCLALGDAVDLRFVQSVELGLALWRLLEKAADQPERLQHPSALGAVRDVLQLAAQIPAHPASMALELAQDLAHALELSGVGVAPDLEGQPRRKAGAVLAQMIPASFAKSTSRVRTGS